MTPAALVGSDLTCGIWCFAMLWSDRVHLPAPLRMGRPLRMVLLLARLVLNIVPAIGIYQHILGLIGK